MKKKKRFIVMTTTRMIMLGFLTAIILGTILLSLPIATKGRIVTPFMDALFTATTSICVTGLSTVSMAEHFSLFGQAVILFLIQFGGLGIVTFTTTLLLLLGKRISLKERLLLQDAYNLDELKGLVRITIRILKGTLMVEGVGALLCCIRFIPQYGFLRGLWFSIFHSVSSFCNAGIDLFGNESLIPYRGDVLINLVTMALIILGGIGFPVWWEFLRNIRQMRRKKRRNERVCFCPNLHFKLAVSATAFLIISGALLTLFLEYNNPQTLGSLPFGEKLLASIFQSVTLRTAGFQTIPQQCFKDGTSMIYLMIMFIGGSPSGTAGGVKTVTMVLVFATVFATVGGKADTQVMRRRIAPKDVQKAFAVFGVGLIVMLLLVAVLMVAENASFLDSMYEMVSATATVGLSRNFTSSLSQVGKGIVILGMYLGRIGPITMALAVNTRHDNSKTSYPDGRVLVG
ncbi:MAG: TrkH family potassium uptake protein [Lachnospiraceae bacterium]|nr:TrkH family potassium uptake protein [Lachnospiraceae bacterium]